MPFNFVIPEITIGGEGTPPLQFYKRGFNLGGSSIPSWQDIILSGNTALTLTNALADGLNYLKLFGGTEQRNLPSEYTQVEYLESSGTQYIDTGVKPNSNTAISIKYYPAVSSAFMCLYGTQDSLSLNRFYGLISITQFRLQINSNAGQPPNYWGINKNGTLVANDNGSFARTQSIVTLGVDNKNKVVSIESDEYTGNISASDTVLGDNLNCQYNMLLLSRGTAGTPANNFSGRLYSFTIKENDVLIQNLIPCRRNSDSVLGMYDTVSGNFLTNAGTGTFTAGSDVTPSPDTPLDIVCNNGVVKVSPNLWNPNATTNYWINTEGELVENTQTRMIRIPATPNDVFTLSATYPETQASNIIVLSFRDSSDNNLLRQFANATASLSITSTAPAGTKSICFAHYINTPTTIQVEAGSTATPYMPYGQIYTDGTVETVEIDTTGDTATAENLFKVGTYQDVQSVIDGGVTRNVGVKVFDGTESWSTGTLTSKTYYAITKSLIDADSTVLPAGSSNIICTHYPVSTSATSSNVRYGEMWVGTSGLNWFVENTTLAQWKQYLVDQYNAGTPVIVVYPLATATTESVTGQPLTIQEGTNIVEITQSAIDNLGLEISYKATV